LLYKFCYDCVIRFINLKLINKFCNSIKQVRYLNVILVLAKNANNLAGLSNLGISTTLK